MLVALNFFLLAYQVIPLTLSHFFFSSCGDLLPLATMKVLTTAALLGATLINSVAAYPHIAGIVAEEMTKTQKDAPTLAERQIQPPSPTFNAKEQYVSTKGKYKWVAPGPSDQRGPCPGLNALANHGYMPHNGIGTITDFIESTYRGFGMGRDLGGFLGVYGAIFDGNLRSYSIGFASAQLPVISGLLGTPQGLGGSHNKYENDASPIRGDLYTYGNSYLNQVSQFKEFLSIHNGVPDNKVNYDVDDILHFRHRRFHHSIATSKSYICGGLLLDQERHPLGSPPSSIIQGWNCIANARERPIFFQRPLLWRHRFHRRLYLHVQVHGQQVTRVP